jgi:hypothetical protein
VSSPAIGLGAQATRRRRGGEALRAQGPRGGRLRPHGRRRRGASGTAGREHLAYRPHSRGGTAVRRERASPARPPARRPRRARAAARRRAGAGGRAGPPAPPLPAP